ncbi:hypothetical protein CN478_03175 [Bacillus cereus]|nr:hypothetical protein CCZ40_20410 [Bacillus thuringiensis]PEB98750.1 hypothetical protein CON04_13510 [Bacillus cereus]PEC25568.1 hypothetical protein CON75_23690 [Bacillus thuringiensis]PEK85951.1 hypothetical protein CN612_17785 [Bacillus thuringiensis]PEQ80532.1 hypothetical protein CN478_03175 [Bacillus cereus]
MYGHFPLFHNHFYPPPKYISDFSNISAQLQIYRRFSKYIGATPNISAIFEIYQLTDKNRHNIHT